VGQHWTIDQGLLPGRDSSGVKRGVGQGEVSQRNCIAGSAFRHDDANTTARAIAVTSDIVGIDSKYIPIGDHLSQSAVDVFSGPGELDLRCQSVADAEHRSTGLRQIPS